MCYANGSIDQAISTCPMCKVFRPSAARCPHKTDTCRNKALHPRHDVVHFKNAEVQSFNGCGYCKWARTNPPPTRSGYYNPGWPGCCRPPLPHEQALVPPADWPAISVVHRVPIPPDIKALLDSLPAMKGHAPQGAMPGAARVTQPASSNDRRNSQASGRSGVTPSTRSSPTATPQKLRSGGSPQQVASSLSSNSSRSSAGPISPVPGGPAIEQPVRRSGPLDTPEKRVDNFRTTPPATVRKLTEADNSPAPLPRRPSISTTINPLPLSTVTAESQPQPTFNRRASASNADASSLHSSPNRVTSTPKIFAKTPHKAESLEDTLSELSMASDSSSDSSSRSSRSSTHDSGTVTSDGGFTDYLSDESEAEIQRQAEARAALLELNRAEEQEFKAARQQLATVDLRPPKAWNPNVTPQRSPAFVPSDTQYLSNHMARGPINAGVADYPFPRGR